jgi:hypothetical protein
VLPNIAKAFGMRAKAKGNTYYNIYNSLSHALRYFFFNIKL